MNTARLTMRTPREMNGVDPSISVKRKPDGGIEVRFTSLIRGEVMLKFSDQDNFIIFSG
jgi:hypothetical protein